MDFNQKLNAAIEKNNSLLCVGLDTDIEKIPQHLLTLADPVFEFNKKIIEQTSDLICCYKANIAYYSALGTKGLESLIKTIDYLKSQHPDIPFILDAKRADVGSTSEKYAKEVFDVLKADSVTVNPYFGLDSLEPLLKYKDKGVIILCKTSNPGAFEFQDLKVDGMPLYIKVAQKIVEWDQKYHNCLMVVGATWPEELKKIREIAPEMFLLIPGIGKQGGDLQKTLEYGLTKNKSGLTPMRSGLIIHSCRDIIYSSSEQNFAEKAREKAIELRNEINKYRK